MQNRNTLLEIVKSKSNQYGVDWRLLDAIICEESGYRPWALRYEPTIILFDNALLHAKANQISLETECNAQACSYGLVQILGRTARMGSLGFTETLPMLFDVDQNLDIGARYLKYLCNKYKKIEDVISAYNAGSPRLDEHGGITEKGMVYVSGVLGFMNKITL